MGKTGKSFLLGAVIGAVAGSVTALLLAPKPGKELRKDIADGARTVADKTQAAAEKVGEQSTELFSRVKSTAGNLVHDIQTRFSKEPAAEEQLLVSSFEDSAELEDEFIEEEDNFGENDLK